MNPSYSPSTAGAIGGDILGVVISSPDVAEPPDEMTQDIGVLWNYRLRNNGDVHASFNRNLFDDRIGSLVIDNPSGRPTSPTCRRRCLAARGRCASARRPTAGRTAARSART